MWLLHHHGCPLALVGAVTALLLLVVVCSMPRAPWAARSAAARVHVHASAFGQKQKIVKWPGNCNFAQTYGKASGCQE